MGGHHDSPSIKLGDKLEEAETHTTEWPATMGPKFPWCRGDSCGPFAAPVSPARLPLVATLQGLLGSCRQDHLCKDHKLARVSWVLSPGTGRGLSSALGGWLFV